MAETSPPPTLGATAASPSDTKTPPWYQSKAPARPNLAALTLFTATATVGLLVLAAVGWALHQPMLIPPLAASMALVAGASALPLAQPRNVVGGQLVSALVGFAVLAVASKGIWAGAVAGGLSLGAMLLLRVSHSPAAATAVIVAVQAPPPAPFLALLTVATLLLVAVGIAGARAGGRKYPVYWW